MIIPIWQVRRTYRDQEVENSTEAASTCVRAPVCLWKCKRTHMSVRVFVLLKNVVLEPFGVGEATTKAKTSSTCA